MFEEDVRVVPRLPLHALGPRLQLVRRVLGTAKTHVAPRRGLHEQRIDVRDLVGVGGAESDVALAKNRVDLVVEPGGVAKLEGDSPLLWQLSDEFVQSRRVLFQKRRKLKKNRTQLRAEGRRSFEEVADVGGDIGEFLLMRNPLRRLEHERKSVRH